MPGTSASRAAAIRKVVRSVAAPDHSAVTDRELLRRFARDNDQTAFEALVNRHTGMVLGVCRRVLPTVQDAEDACQAAFVVLAGKAGGRWQESVANWLFTTARNVAQNAKLASARRAKREASAAVPESIEPVDRMTGRELLAALDEALDGLPARYREPLVLCYLEGLTRDEAAVRLGIPLATLHTRIDRARKRLHDALTKAGCALGIGLLALVVNSPAGASPPRLVKSIIVAASGSSPAAVGELVKGVAVNGAFKQTVLVLGAVVAIALGIGGGLPGTRTAGQALDRPQEPTKVKGHAAPPAEVAPEVTFSGRVLGPDGRPLAGAKVWVVPRTRLEDGFEALSAPDLVGTDGRFRFTVPKEKTRHPKYGYEMDATVVATAPNFFPGWAVEREDVTLRLAKADVKVTGRVVNLEGVPVAGATVRVTGVSAPVAGTLDPWLKALREKAPSSALVGHFGRGLSVLPGVPTTARTGADGKFELNGYGRDLHLSAVVEGPGVATQGVAFITREGGTSAVAFAAGSPIYGIGGTVTAAPSRPITGVVHDRQTQKPLAGVEIESVMLAGSSQFQVGLVRTRTGADGRFTLEGMPIGSGNTIAAVPDTAQAHLTASAVVPDRPGTAPVVVDFELSRGVWVEGSVRDQQGEPLPRVWAVYYPDETNVAVQKSNPLGVGRGAALTGPDGKFRTVGLPGKGYLVVTADGGHYLTAADRTEEGGISATVLTTLPYRVRTDSVNAAYAIDVPPKADSFRRDAVLERGTDVVVTLVGPDGKPVVGGRSFGAAPAGGWAGETRPGEHRVPAYNPARPRTVLFRHPEKNLVARLELPKDFTGTKHAVEMRPGVAVTGRVLDADGKPRAGLVVETSFLWSRWDDSSEAWSRVTPGPERIATDAEGRFRVPALAPGTSYAVIVKSRYLSEFRLDPSPSGVKALGDLRLPLGEN